MTKQIITIWVYPTSSPRKAQLTLDSIEIRYSNNLDSFWRRFRLSMCHPCPHIWDLISRSNPAGSRICKMNQYLDSNYWMLMLGKVGPRPRKWRNLV